MLPYSGGALIRGALFVREWKMKVVLTGSVAFDNLMTFPGLFREQILPEKLDALSLSFLVDTLFRHRGGVAGNIAYTLALLGEQPYLMATVGKDFADYRAALEAGGADLSLTRTRSASPAPSSPPPTKPTASWPPSTRGRWPAPRSFPCAGWIRNRIGW
jgi:hypothetical protein